MEENFDRAFAWILRAEGGYVADPDDPGGETKFGISKRVYPKLDIKAITEDLARELYRHDYWDACGCDALPAGIDIAVFDTAVNMGRLTAIAILKQTRDVEGYLWNRLSRYVALAARGNNIKFLRGWCNRLIALCEVIGG
jgi:lysozyme family protein